MQVLNQDETPLLYSLVFGEGVVNDATSVVLFNAIQSFDLSHINLSIALKFVGSFFYLFIASTMLGVIVSLYALPFPSVCFRLYMYNYIIFFFISCRLDCLVHSLSKNFTWAGSILSVTVIILLNALCLWFRKLRLPE